MMKVLEHDHPLKLIDLQMKKDVESDDEEEENGIDLVAQNEFSCTCKRCGEDINEYYRYYYKCIDDSCDFSLHKFCAELPTTLKHASHPDTLTLLQAFSAETRFKQESGKTPLAILQLVSSWRCVHCRTLHTEDEVCYSYVIDVKCAVEVNEKKIQHPSHPHPLVSLISKAIICVCDACGNEQKGLFFQCTTCSNFAIHKDCAFLPKSLFIQHTTNDSFHHTHPLTLSYSFPNEEKMAMHSPTCRVCDYSFFESLWIYRCLKCIYYVHLHCITSKKNNQTVKNYKDADYPDLLHLPFPDESYSIQKHLFFKEITPAMYRTGEVSLQHINHQHDLILVDTKCTSSNSTIMCHNPMKKIELLCNACVRPIMEMPFYKCGANEKASCNFALHEWCTRLPTKVDNYPGHPKHPLVLMSNIPHSSFNIFDCAICGFPCNGYAYVCLKCGYYVDVTCGVMPDKITHKSHPNHLFSRVMKSPYNYTCLMCRTHYSGQKKLCYSCNICDVYIDPECALLLLDTIRHPLDKHPMHLSYLPIENHKSEYFCEICEEDLNPHSCFYHCKECAQSVHCACAPLTLCEKEMHSSDDFPYKIYRFLNVKFGSIHYTDIHSHPLSFDQGIVYDGDCIQCGLHLRYKMIFKCLECQFAIHHGSCMYFQKRKNFRFALPMW